MRLSYLTIASASDGDGPARGATWRAVAASRRAVEEAASIVRAVVARGDAAMGGERGSEGGSSR